MTLFCVYIYIILYSNDSPIAKANPLKAKPEKSQKFKFAWVELPSPTVNAKSFRVSILITSWHLSPMPDLSAKRPARKSMLLLELHFLWNLVKKKFLLNAFITSQFPYAPLVCVFHNRKLSSHINHIHETPLRIAYQNHNWTFDELLAKDGWFKFLDCNLQKLLIEIFKVKMRVAPGIMNQVSDIIVCSYPLRNELIFKARNIRIVRYGIEIAAFVGSKIWSYIPSELN